MDKTTELDTEALVSISEKVEAGRTWAKVTRDKLATAGRPVLVVTSAYSSESSMTVHIEPDEAGTEAALEMAARHGPSLVLFCAQGEFTMSFHLAWRGTWADVVCLVSEVPDEDDGLHTSEHDDDESKISDARRHELTGLVAEVAAQLVVDDEPKAHRNAAAVREAIEARPSAVGVSAQEFRLLFFPLRNEAASALEQLKANHITRLAADTDAYVTQVLAHTAIPRDAKVAVIQAAAYAYMKSLDSKCGEHHQRGARGSGAYAALGAGRSSGEPQLGQRQAPGPVARLPGMDIEAIAKIATDINDGLIWGQDALESLEMAGHPVLEVTLVAQSTPSMMIVVAPNEAGTEALVELADRLKPAVVLYTDDVTGDGIPVITFHLGWSGSWADVRCYVADAVPPPTIDRRAELRALLDSTVKQMLADDAPKAHMAWPQVQDEIEKRLALAGIPADRARALYGDLRAVAEKAHSDLLGQHRASFRAEAKAYAQAVIDLVATRDGAGSVATKFDVSMHLRTTHRGCATSSSIEPVDRALETLLRAQA